MEDEIRFTGIGPDGGYFQTQEVQGERDGFEAGFQEGRRCVRIGEVGEISLASAADKDEFDGCGDGGVDDEEFGFIRDEVWAWGGKLYD